MTDLLTSDESNAASAADDESTSTEPQAAETVGVPVATDPPEPPALVPPAPPTPPPADAPQDKERPGRSGWRFTGGLVTGVVVSAIAVGAVAIARDGDDAATPAEAPATTVSADERAVDEQRADEPAVTVVPAGSSVHDLVVAVRPAIVAIHTTVTQTDFFGQEVEGAAAGSGFVLSGDGYIVTNNHVIEGAEEIEVTLDDGTTETAELIGADPRSDLAVLKIERTDLSPLQVGDSDALRVGDPVVAIGNALDLGAEPTVTGGLVSAKDRTITEPNGSVLVDLIQTDAAISPGNSGGPLLDMTGQVVGINTAVAGQGQNIGFAISINRAQVLIDQLREGNVPRHALLGVTTRPAPDGGVVVVAVQPGSAADTAGMLEGDVITAVDGETIDAPEELAATIASSQPGDEIEVTIDRDGDEQVLTVALGARDETNQ
jgi:S1-C subfamily serine protease